MKNEAVKINVKEVKMEAKKVGDGIPMCSKFKFIPKQAPQISEGVNSIGWDSHKRTIKLSITETTDFSVYSWIEYLKSIWAESKQGPFVSQPEADLVFLDALGNKLTALRFENIYIRKHECHLHKTINDRLAHLVGLGYKNSCIVKEPEEFLMETENEVIDQEWQAKSD